MVNLRILLSLFLLLSLNGLSNAQGLFMQADQIANAIVAAESEETKIHLNDSLKIFLEETFLNNNEIYLSSLEELNTIVWLHPNDSQFVLLNWSIPYSDGTYSYECALWINDGSKNSIRFLKAAPADSSNSQTWIGGANEWIPGLYYELIEHQGKFNSYYTLLKWDGNNLLTNKKSIEIAYLDRSKDFRFGVPIIKKESNALTRMVFEYSAQNKMMLSYNSSLQRIEMDHLSPPDNTLIGVYSYYGPDLSYDALVWKNLRWEHQELIDMEDGLKNKKKDFRQQEKKKMEIIKEKQPIYQPTILE